MGPVFMVYSYYFLSSADFFSKISFWNTIRVSNSVGPDLGPNCLQRLSADNTRR